MTRLYLIRHAEAEGNLYRVAHGHCNGLITNYRGYQQIDALRERFRKVDIDAVYSSDLYRTQITARAIWLPKALPLHLEPAFREICMGEWEDHTWHELNVRYPEEMYNFNRRADLWRVPGAETAQQVVDRFIPALERVARAHEGGTAAVFSHGMALRTVLGVLQGQTLAEVGQTPHGDNTAVSLLEWENGTFRVVYRDDNSHLTERGLSTFARQSWWKEKNMVESGEGYGPLPEEKRAALGMPAGGEATGVWYGEVDTMTPAQWKTLCDTNLSSAVYLSQCASRSMIRQKSGAIVNVSSIWGVSGAAMEVAYSAAKAGMLGLTRALALELAPSNITVNAVAPGYIDTKMNAHLSEDEKKALCEEIPLGRAGTPAEVAAGVRFLAESPYITGETLVISGGWR